jgi:hypothetical protein
MADPTPRTFRISALAVAAEQLALCNGPVKGHIAADALSSLATIFRDEDFRLTEDMLEGLTMLMVETTHLLIQLTNRDLGG